MEELRSLSADEYQHLKTDHAGNLYWRGSRVRTGGWAVSDRLSLGALIVAALSLLLTGLVAVKDIPEIGNAWRSLRDGAGLARPAGP